MTADRAPKVRARAQEVLDQARITENSYLRTLADGSMTKAAFQSSQEQFFFAVTFFPRPMAALVGRIVDPHHRLDILRNLVEEHGEFDARAFHHNTFKRFLTSLGSNPEALDGTSLWPEVRAFNSVLTAACLLDELEVGISCMGIIEHAFAGISAAIGTSVVRRGWVEPSRLTHYKLHSEIDDRHADEFYAVVEPAWVVPARRYLIEQGLALGAYVFDRLYTDLYARTTRSTAPGQGSRP